MPSRRTYLAGVGASVAGLAGLAGCAGSGDGTTDAPTSARYSTGRSGTDTTERSVRTHAFGESAGGVSVSGFRHRHSVVTTAIDSSYVYEFDGQGVFVTLDATGASDPPEVDDVSLVADGERYPAAQFFDQTASPSFFEGERPYGEGNDEFSGWLVFAVPCPLDAADARIEIGDDTWALSDDATNALAQPAPAFSLVSFDHPDEVPADEPVTLSATVEHEGGPGLLRAVFTERVRLYNEDRVEQTVEGTTTVSVEFDDHVDAPDDVDDVLLGVEGPDFAESVTVPIRRE